jgi:hypothetical protein
MDARPTSRRRLRPTRTGDAGDSDRGDLVTTSLARRPPAGAGTSRRSRHQCWAPRRPPSVRRRTAVHHQVRRRAPSPGGSRTGRARPDRPRLDSPAGAGVAGTPAGRGRRDRRGGAIAPDRGRLLAAEAERAGRAARISGGGAGGPGDCGAAGARGDPPDRVRPPGGARGDAAVRDLGPARRALVSGQCGVHPAGQRSAPAGRGLRDHAGGHVPGRRAGRRLPRRACRRTGRSPAPAGDHEVQPGPDLDAAERGRDRRDLPLRVRHGRTRWVPIGRAHRPGLAAEQLAHERAEIKAGRADLRVSPATFSIADVRRIEQEAPVDIATVRAKRRAAFDAERARWGA